MQTLCLLIGLLGLGPQEAPAPAPAQQPAPAPAAQDPSPARLPLEALTGFSQTPASGVDDLFGQALLLEFFAHW